MMSTLSEAICLSVHKLTHLKSDQYFHELSGVLANLINADHTFIARLSQDNNKATTIAFHSKGKIEENFSYDLINTPCQDLTQMGTCSIVENICAMYPKDQMLFDMKIEGYLGGALRDSQKKVIGLMVGLFERPIEECDVRQQTFNIFNLQASSELERTCYEELLNEKIKTLAQQNEKLLVAQKVYDYTADGIIVTDSNNSIVYTNKKIETMSGYNAEELHGKNPRVLNSGLQNVNFYKNLWGNLKSLGFWQGEMLNRHKNGHIYPIFTSITNISDEEGNIKNHIAIHRDITKEKEADKLISYQATHDLLTNLLNRYEFNDQIRLYIELLKKKQSRSAFILINLDDFKEINDSAGLNYGDQILRHVSLRLQDTIRDNDLLARLSGDEFAVFAELQDKNHAQHLINRIQSIFLQPLKLSGDEYQDINASIGVSFYPDDSSTPEELFTHAEIALDYCKREARGAHTLFNSQLRQQQLREKAIKQKLKQAIDNGDLEPHFQPILHAESETVSHCEALARWHDNELGPVFPDEFICIAERYGYMPQLGNLIADKAISYMAALNQRLGINIGITINRSPQELQLRNEEPLLAIAEKHHFPIEQIGIELTENLMIKKPDLAKRQLNALRDKGFLLLMDDFGTGYSSLAYMKDFPFDTLKIDRAFISDLCSKNESQTLVKAIISVAHSFNMSTVAEGVENEAQKDILCELGNDYIQGYHYSPPLPIDQLETYLKSRKHLLPETKVKLSVSGR